MNTTGKALAKLTLLVCLLLLLAPAKRVLAAPGAPNNVFAGPLTSMDIGVNWVPVSGATGYKVFRSTNGTTYSQVGTVTGYLNAYFVDAGLSGSTLYYYRVKAYDGSGDSAYSSATSYAQTTTLAPRAPRNVQATFGDQRVTVTWNPNPESNLSGYNIYRSTVSDGTFTKLNTSLLTVTTYTDTTVTNYVDYYYEVRAVDSKGQEGAPSPERWALPEANPPAHIPHGPYASTTSECSTCHTTHQAAGPRLLNQSQEVAVCFFCHNGTGSQNVTYQEFANYPSRHPVPAGANPGTMKCSDCHDPHLDYRATDGNGKKLYPKLLKVDYNGIKHKGNDICYKCHGVGSTKVGGDHETAFRSGIHNTAVPLPPSGTEIICINCHLPHGSPNARLKVYKEENACFQCHYPETSTAGAPDIYDRVYANPQHTTHHDIFDADQQANGSKIECVNCHNPHGVTSARKNVDPDAPSPNNLWTGSIRGFCEKCHDGTFPNSTQTQPYAPGVTSGTEALINIKSAYLVDQHGDGLAGTPVFDPAMGWAKGDVVPCSQCHEPHGTSNVWNLRSKVYSKDGSMSKDGLLVLPMAGGGADYRYFCNACHGRGHMGNNKTWPTNCMTSNCHKHGTGKF